jgi:hypothetical protein
MEASNTGDKMKENKEQWNHRIRVELADGMRELRDRRDSTPTMRELTEEALELLLKFNGIKVKDAA